MSKLNNLQISVSRVRKNLDIVNQRNVLLKQFVS
jgi:hypothetical protein